MARKNQARFVCNNCGAVFPTWSGRCSSCEQWNTLEEQVEVTSARLTSSGKALVAEVVGKVNTRESGRITTTVNEVDTVLGGGFVPGSVVLIAGEPGIGKSTLLLQISSSVSKSKSVLYVSGEESAHQVSDRAKRLGVDKTPMELAVSGSANDIAATISSGKYKLVIVDSIQTVTCQEIASAAGTMSQITNSTQLLTAAAKNSNTTLLIVGHVTKEGNIAGPKLLEHSVDVVLQLEGDRFGGFKMLRAIKNRYGATHEVGIFEMGETGLLPVANPSAALLAERKITDGSVVLATIEGSRALLVEIQALVNKTAFGYPKRAASGFDANRLNLLIAMLERRTKLNLSDKDIYINVVGGMRLTEPAADLAICMAIASATKEMQLKQNAVVFGEVGLSGELRHVPFIEKRADEAKRMGFDVAIGPKMLGQKKQPTLLHSVTDVRTALNTFLSKD